MSVSNVEVIAELNSIDVLSEFAKNYADRFEEQRRIDSDYHRMLRDAGLYRILIPQDSNGRGGSLVDWYNSVSKLASADPAVGWCVAHGAMTSAILYSVSNKRFRQNFFANPDHTAAWSNLGKNDVVPKDNGIQISGRWAFVTGCTNASHVGGTVRVPIGDSGDKIRIVSVLLPASEVTIEETWNPVGLAGSGSHDVVVKDAFVPEDNMFVWPRPWRDTSNSTGEHNTTIPSALDALVSGTIPISLCCAATQLGIAKGALTEVAQQLHGKKDAFSGKHACQRPHVMTEVEFAHSELVVLETAFLSLLEQIWTSGSNTGDLDQTLRMNVRLACVNIVHRCRDIVQAAFSASGAAALSKNGRLQKLYRDASCLTSHVSVSKSSFEITSGVRNDLDQASWL